MSVHDQFLERAVQIALDNVRKGSGGPFGAVVVKDGKIISESGNEVTTILDPSAHAEIQAIRKACQKLKNFQLANCILYSSCEPCPMCLGAIYWARPQAVYFAATRQDAARAGFDDDFIYSEIAAQLENRKIPFQAFKLESALSPFRQWQDSTSKTLY